MKDEIELYGSAATYYFKSRPGLTGVWQISGRNDVNYDERIAFDKHYVENWSFPKDINYSQDHSRYMRVSRIVLKRFGRLLS
nr:sugar transferase [Phyllobacterium sp. IY22]